MTTTSTQTDQVQSGIGFFRASPATLADASTLTTSTIFEQASTSGVGFGDGAQNVTGFGRASTSALGDTFGLALPRTSTAVLGDPFG
jgi:hypothetical protein